MADEAFRSAVGSDGQAGGRSTLPEICFAKKLGVGRVRVLCSTIWDAPQRAGRKYRYRRCLFECRGVLTVDEVAGDAAGLGPDGGWVRDLRVGGGRAACRQRGSAPRGLLLINARGLKARAFPPEDAESLSPTLCFARMGHPGFVVWDWKSPHPRWKSTKASTPVQYPSPTTKTGVPHPCEARVGLRDSASRVEGHGL